MKIGIDISTILNHGKDIGSGRYIYNLVKNLILLSKKNKSNDEFILTGRYTTDDYIGIANELISTINNSTNLSNPNDPSDRSSKNIVSTKLFKTTPKKLKIWNKLRFPPIEFLGFKADLIHFPDFLMVPTLNKNTVLTINDLAFIRYPEFNFDWFIKKYTKEVKRNAYIAKKIIAISGSTKNDIVNFLNIDANKVCVTHLAADDTFKKLSKSEVDKSVLEKYKISKKFILSVGTIEPRKNYPKLIKAFNIIKETLKDKQDYMLVIAGRIGWKSEETFEEFNKSPYKDDIIFTKRVSDYELLNLYNLAEVFVYPSIFEGFGLPIVEAFACGCAVLASNSSSIPELFNLKLNKNKELNEFKKLKQNQSIKISTKNINFSNLSSPNENNKSYNQQAFCLFNPNNEDEIAQKILDVLINEKLKSILKENSTVLAKNFNWQNTALNTLKVYYEI